MKTHLSQVTKPESIIARNWADLGVHYVKTRYYLKALLCFKTALSVDSNSVEVEHDIVNRLICKGRLQDAYEIVLKVKCQFHQDIKDPWALV